jgi:hypothetical protein
MGVLRGIHLHGPVVVGKGRVPMRADRGGLRLTQQMALAGWAARGKVCRPMSGKLVSHTKVWPVASGNACHAGKWLTHRLAPVCTWMACMPRGQSTKANSRVPGIQLSWVIHCWSLSRWYSVHGGAHRRCQSTGDRSSARHKKSVRVIGAKLRMPNDGIVKSLVWWFAVASR